MSGNYTVRLAEAQDVAGLAELLRDEMPSELRGLTIYDCRGVKSYIRENLAHPSVAPVYYVVAESCGALAGALEMRQTGECLFLQYVAVAPQHRRRGLAQRLLLGAIGARPTVQTLGLHVLDTNTIARDWYRHIGLKTTGHIDWWIGDLHSAAEQEPANIVDPATTRERWERLGFSQARVKGNCGVMTVGILGGSWLRFPGWVMLLQDEVVAALKREWPGRRALVLSKEIPPASLAARFTRIARALEMEGRIVELQLEH